MEIFLELLHGNIVWLSQRDQSAEENKGY